jgi:hypothetical protein
MAFKKYELRVVIESGNDEFWDSDPGIAEVALQMKEDLEYFNCTIYPLKESREWADVFNEPVAQRKPRRLDRATQRPERPIRRPDPEEQYEEVQEWDEVIEDPVAEQYMEDAEDVNFPSKASRGIMPPHEEFEVEGHVDDFQDNAYYNFEGVEDYDGVQPEPKRMVPRKIEKPTMKRVEPEPYNFEEDNFEDAPELRQYRQR